MFNGEPLTRSGFSDKSWRPFADFLFAKQIPEAPITLVEMESCSKIFPIILRSFGGRVRPCAVLGIGPQENLLVGDDGKWLGAYVPAVFRGYPFFISSGQDGQDLLSVVTESSLVGVGFERRMFDADGQLAPELKQVADFLQAIVKDEYQTRAVVDLVRAEGLLVDWLVTFKDGETERPYPGLLRVDEQKLNNLGADALERLARGGALRFCYAQIFSQKNFQTLVNLHQARAGQVKPTNDVDVDKILSAVGTSLGEPEEPTKAEDTLPVQVYDDGEIDLASLIGNRKDEDR